jgi:hypothetical protein
MPMTTLGLHGMAGTLAKRGLPSGMGDSWNSEMGRSAAVMEHD